VVAVESVKAGNKCPRCKEGMVVRDELGFSCDECPWRMDIETVVKEVEKAKFAGFKSRVFRITIDDPEDAEDFLRGLIVARSNNSSEYFVDLIDAVNTILEPWREAKQAEEMKARAQAGMG